MTELINSDVGGSRVAVEARGISKSFGGTVALQGADLTASYGQVFAVLGENGAGKSTLMKVLAGALRPDSGTVTIDGSSLRLGDPLSAEAAGIGAVFQELTVIPDLTVAQNIFLRREPRRGGLVNLRKLVEATEQLFDDLSVTGIPPSRRGRDLTLAQKQIVEIVKVTARRPSIVILDEPTSALGEEQVAWLLAQVRAWRAEGRCVLLITHRFAEVKEMADVLGVYRAGHLVKTFLAGEADDDDVMRAMCGRDVDRMIPSPPPLGPGAPTVLAVEGFRLHGSRGKTDLDLHAGENPRRRRPGRPGTARVLSGAVRRRPLPGHHPGQRQGGPHPPAHRRHPRRPRYRPGASRAQDRRTALASQRAARTWRWPLCGRFPAGV